MNKMSGTFYIGASRSSSSEGAGGTERATVVGVVAWWNGVARGCARFDVVT